MWNEDKKLVVKYSKSKDIDVSNFINVLKNTYTYFNIW